MELIEKTKLLGDSAKYDASNSSLIENYLKVASQKFKKVSGLGGIYQAVLPNGRCVPIFKTLMSNACKNDCFYCVNRAGRDFRRTKFQPEELAKLFMELYQRGLVRGLFLSSAVEDSSSYSMELMIKAVEIIRHKYNYTDYLHLKILPGAHPSYMERAAQLADRLSINLEAPNPQELNKLSHSKNFEEDLLKRLVWLKSLAERYQPRSGLVTQFVVGAADEKDQELLKLTSELYQNLSLRRAYFQAFQPVSNTPLEGHPPTPPTREHRLYQADFLMRTYDFKFVDLQFDQQDNLPLHLDPKLFIAIKRKALFPIEINKADYEELLRIPGIGPVSAKRIIKERFRGKLTDLKDLQALGAVTKRARHFILINGHSYGNPDEITISRPAARQLALSLSF